MKRITNFETLFCIIALLSLLQCVAFGSELYPDPTDFSFDGVYSWGQPKFASGTVTPELASAAENEIFINTATPTLTTLQIKVQGAWRNIRGEKGDQGEIGATGPIGLTGAEGPAGPIGATGSIGLTGPQGPVGATGAQGLTGADGPIGATGSIGLTGPQGEIGATGSAGLDGNPGIATSTIVDYIASDTIAWQAAVDDLQPIASMSNYASKNGNSGENFNTLNLIAAGVISGSNFISSGTSLAIGSGTWANRKGDYNTAFGDYALYANSTGSYNLALGCDALGFNTTGSNNVAIGHCSMLYGSYTGNYNTAVGVYSLYGAGIGSGQGNGNTALGSYALYYHPGSYTVGIGFSAGSNATNGSPNISSQNSVFLGANTRGGADNETVIGYAADGHGANTVTIGNASVTANYFSQAVYASGTRLVDANGVGVASHAFTLALDQTMLGGTGGGVSTDTVIAYIATETAARIAADALLGGAYTVPDWTGVDWSAANASSGLFLAGMLNYPMNMNMVYSCVAPAINANLYDGMIGLPNGYVCLMPGTNDTVGLLKNETMAVTAGATASTTNSIWEYNSMVLWKNKVIFIPGTSDWFGRYDWVLNTFAMGALATTTNTSWAAGCMMPNGIMCIVPNTTANGFVGLYNVSSDTFELGPDTGMKGAAVLWNQAILAANGKVYFMPRSQGAGSRIGIYNPSDNSFAYTGSFAAWAWGNGGILLNNGKILILPSADDYLGLFDPSDNSFASGPALLATTDDKYCAAMNMPNGKVALLPYKGAAFIDFYDPVANTLTRGPVSVIMTNAYTAACQMSNGDIYMFDMSQSTTTYQRVLRNFIPNANPYAFCNPWTGTNPHR